MWNKRIITTDLNFTTSDNTILFKDLTCLTFMLFYQISYKYIISTTYTINMLFNYSMQLDSSADRHKILLITKRTYLSKRVSFIGCEFIRWNGCIHLLDHVINPLKYKILWVKYWHVRSLYICEYNNEEKLVPILSCPYYSMAIRL